MRPARFFVLVGAVAVPGSAAGPSTDLVTVTIPRLDVAEYHRPYVAIWLDQAGGGSVRTLAVWYDAKKGGNEPGTKWLADLRSWWRKGGRALHLPADGISGATRAPGQYSVALPADLKPGGYVLNVEAARETGGRELVSVPLTVPRPSGRAAGRTELAAVTVAPR